jgi:acyl carrier protein
MLIITDTIEKHFNIEFDDDDMEYEHIFSLGTITKVIQYKVQMKE